MKKRILSTLMIITFLAFVLTEFCACNNLFQNSLLEKPEANTSKYYTVSGDILNVQNGCRSAYPENVTNIFYNVYAKETPAVSPAIIPGTVTSGSSSYTISGLTVGKWKIIAEGYSSSAKNSDTLIVVGEIEIDIGTTPDLTNLIIYATGVTGPGKKGTVNLPITIEDVNQIKYAEMTWKNTSGVDCIQGLEYTANGQTNYFTMNALTSVDAGDYEVKFNFYDDSTNKKLKYSFTQTVYVYSNMETNTLVGSASYISAGKIVITSAIATWGNKTEFYVSSSGNNNNTGGFFTPFETIDKAIAVIKSINDGTTNYKIKLLTNVTADSVTDVTGIGNTYVVISSDKTLNLEISSYSSPCKINADGLSTGARVIYVGENVNLTLGNVTVTGGKPVKSHGAGVYVSSGAKLILNNGAIVTQNAIVTNNDDNSGYGYLGNGIYCAGSLVINDNAQVTYNASDNPTTDVIKGGGIYYKPGTAGDSFVMNDGTISYNAASHGGGIVIYGGASAKIEKGTISNNTTYVTGGGVWNSNENLVIQDCTFKQNEARNGGGIFTSSNLTVTNCVFEDNTSIKKNGEGGNGAGIGIWKGNVTISGSRTAFRGNAAQVNGGAIYCSSKAEYDDSSVTLSAGTFSANTADKGAGVYVADYQKDATTYFTASFNLSGSVSMDDDQVIYLGYLLGSPDQVQKYITIGALTGDSSQKFKLELEDYTIGTQILKGTSANVSSGCSKFELIDPNWYLDSSGKIVKLNYTMTELKNLPSASIPTTGRVTIADLSDYDDFVSLVNVGKSFEGLTFTLGDDINITGTYTPIGNSSTKYFAGTFNGNGKTISVSNIAVSSANSGLFGYTKNATIKNLNVKINSITGSSVDNIGGIVGNASGNITIENCTVDTNIDCSSSKCVGGLIGVADSSGKTITIKNCMKKGYVKGKGYTGGLIGRIMACSSLEIVNCSFWGEISSTTSGDYTGGLVGYAKANNSHIENCYVNTINSPTGTFMKGILVGFLSATGEFKNCYYFKFGSEALAYSSSPTPDSSCLQITYGAAGTRADGSGKEGWVLSSDSTKDIVTILNSWISTQSNPAEYKTWQYVDLADSYYIGFTN